MSTNDESSSERLVNEVIASYLAACDAGNPPNRKELLAGYPDIADELNAFFEDQDRVQSFAERDSAGAKRGNASSIVAALEPESARPSREIFDIGSIVAGRYRVVGMTAGGMGRVYFADDLDVGQYGTALRVAIKTVPDFAEWRDTRLLKGERTDTFLYSGQVTRFRREALTWVRLGMHPNIVWAMLVLDIGAKPYLVMEYADGGDLRTWIKGGRLSLPLAMNFALQFCEGMKHAVRATSMVHRDIKPANVLIKGNRMLKITDFGLAKAFDPDIDSSEVARGAETAFTLSDIVGGGTREYMAPEQFRSFRQADTRSDIFSFGAMFYEMLTGRQLFTPTSAYDFAINGGVLTRVDEIDRAIPAPLSTVVSRCIEHAPAKRYESFAELSVALGLVYASLPGATPLPTDDGHARRAALLTPSLQLLVETYTLITLGRYAEARDAASKAIHVDPRNADHWINKGKAQAELGDFHSARSCWLEATRLNPDDVHGWANLGWANLVLGDAVAGLDAARRAINLDAGFGDAWMCQGACERQLGRITNGVLSMERAAQLEPYNWKAHSNLGSCLKELDRFAEAFEALTRAVEVNPRDVGSWLELAWLHARVQSWEEATQAVNCALQGDSRNATAWAMRAWTLWADGGDADEVKAALRLALEIDASNHHAKVVQQAVATTAPGRGRARRSHSVNGAEPEGASFDVEHVLPNHDWTIVSGTRAKLQAIEQNVMDVATRFAAALVVPKRTNTPKWIGITAVVLCHDCGDSFPLEHELSSSFGMKSTLLHCRCGSQITLLACRARKTDGYFLVLSPFTCRVGVSPGSIDIEILNIRTAHS